MSLKMIKMEKDKKRALKGFREKQEKGTRKAKENKRVLKKRKMRWE